MWTSREYAYVSYQWRTELVEVRNVAPLNIQQETKLREANENYRRLASFYLWERECIVEDISLAKSED